MKKQEFIKKIPNEWQEKLGATRFKISLIKARNLKEATLLKAYLEFKTRDIYANENLQTKQASVQYLKDCVLLYMLGKSDLNNATTYKPKIILTFQQIMQKAIKEREKDYLTKQKILSSQGVDIKIKRDGTLLAYNAILAKVNLYFKNDYDISNLTFKIAKDFSLTLNKSYVAHLKSIFKKLNIENKDIPNHFANLTISVEERYSNINKKIDIFTFQEIETIKENLNDEQGLFFKVLLLSGMRFDEIISIKKINIKNNCFYFKDSKSYFDKIVPIHFELIDEIKNKILKLKDNDYLFFNINKKRDIGNIRIKINSILKKYSNKTLHKTRATFITYLNYFRNDFNTLDIKSFTHQLSGIDQKNYNATKNVDRLKEIINSIDLKNLSIIEEQEKQFLAS